MIFYLFTLIFASNALSLVSIGKVLGENSTAKKSPGLLESVKANPKQFVEEMQNLDPESLQHVITLLEELKASSEARETHLVDDLSAKNTALDQANARVIQKEGVLNDANGDVTAAEGALTVAQQAASAASTDLDNERTVQAGKQAEKDASQTAHDDELPSLNDEQTVLADVIDMLNGLPDAASCPANPPTIQQNGMDKNALVKLGQGTVSFGSGSLGGYCSSTSGGTSEEHSADTGIHCFKNINDGTYGNSYSWIPGHGSGWVGFRLDGDNGRHTVKGFCLSRDRNGHYGDRSHDTLTLEVSFEDNESGDGPWCRLGSISRGGAWNELCYSLDTPVSGVKAVRMLTNNAGTCIDELEIFATD